MQSPMMRPFRLFAVLGLLAAPAGAQTPSETPPPTFEEAVTAFAVKPPDESSPFFADRELARRERRVAAGEELTAATGPNQTAIYPRVGEETQSASQTFTSFFTNMFASVRFNPFRKRPETLRQLKLDPAEFSLSDRREIDATYSVRNETRKIMRLDFPTTQRIEILTKNEDLEVIDRWSDDRTFEDDEGIVFINPGERISYNQPVPTRDMKPREIHTISAEIVGYPEFTAGKRVTPYP
jgi:hypothetical protein